MPETHHLACICCPATVTGPPVALEPWIVLEDAPGWGICEPCYMAIAATAIQQRITAFVSTWRGGL